jgi:hypothetical protein
VGAFTNAYRDYSQYNGQFRGAARGSLFAGIILTLVACIFLFGLSWGLILPVILIAVGVSLLFKVI